MIQNTVPQKTTKKLKQSKKKKKNSLEQNHQPKVVIKREEGQALILELIGVNVGQLK